MRTLSTAGSPYPISVATGTMGYRVRNTSVTAAVMAALFMLVADKGTTASAFAPISPSPRIAPQAVRGQDTAGRHRFDSQAQGFTSSVSPRSTAPSLSLFRSSVTGESVSWMPKLPGLSRPHELLLFILYGGVTSAFLASATQRPVLYSAAEAAVALVWVTMILTISFMESWVKFKAPFLNKPAALDVGRHVFAGLNAMELAVSGSFWMGRVWRCRINNAFVQSQAYYLHPNFVLPALATTALLAQVTIVAPVLYLRAKAILVRSFSEGPSSAKESLTKFQKEQLAAITLDAHTSVRQVGMIPPIAWHKSYIALEFVKTGCLVGFVALKWLSI